MGAGAENSESQWRRCDPGDCVWADCGDGFVVYHRPSGKTHLMNDASAALLTEVLAEPKTIAAIAAAFDPPPDVAATDEYTAHMASLILRLEHFGLLERA